MKKLMFAIMVVGAAIYANAAAINWTASGVCDPVATAAAGKNTPCDSWLGYIILASDFETVSGDLATGDTSSLLAKTIQPGKASSNKGAFGAGDAAGNVTAGSQNFYMIVLNSKTVAGATSFFTASGSANVDASMDTTVQFGNVANTSKLASNWTSMAPEPTSGLLLLIGMGALALRRRRA